MIRLKLKDKHLLQIIKQIIESYKTVKGKGLPIGNLTSQYFANYYLSYADRYIQHELKIPAYVRYMDDMVLWCVDKEKLIHSRNEITKFLKERLSLHLKTSTLNNNEHGLSFLGYRVFRDKTRLNTRSKKRFINKSKQYANNLATSKWTQEEYQKHILPSLACTRYADTKGLREKIYNERIIIAGSNRVIRGGSWNNNTDNCRVANRNNYNADNSNNNIGFRLALSSQKGWMSVYEQIIIPVPDTNQDK